LRATSGGITQTGKVLEFPLPTSNAQPQVITRGSGIGFWFTEFNANQIGRITITH
jgi:virginiamycin B lyase